MDDGEWSTIEAYLEHFLTKTFGAFSSFRAHNYGFWENADRKVVYDECSVYEISFLGKERIPKLLEKLAEIAVLIGEDCIYFKAGQYACTIHPKKR
jgi:hypothetical protein